ncbi:MAG: DUF1513 domain-containing protein [Pseudomonadota bacterium]
MTITRRDFTQSMLGSVAAISLPSAPALARTNDAYYVSAQGELDDADGGLVAMNARSGQWFKIAVPFRGHDVIEHPKRPGHVLMFARRPGFYVQEFDLNTRQRTKGFRLKGDRQGFGHGVFSADGAVLLTAEGVISTGRGLIVVRDALSYDVLAEWSSGGVGPHEVVCMPNSDLLAVANGGLRTHPRSGREVLNLETMRSNLSYLDTRTGELVALVESPHPRASIRHIDVSDDGTVAIATQFQRLPGEQTANIPLAALHRAGGDIEVLDAPTTVLAALNDYMGSVCVDSKSQLAGFTSPRGNLAIFWNLKTGELIGHHSLRDVCGITLLPNSSKFVLTNSTGELRVLDHHHAHNKPQQRLKVSGLHWDNHLNTVFLERGISA